MKISPLKWVEGPAPKMIRAELIFKIRYELKDSIHLGFYFIHWENKTKEVWAYMPGCSKQYFKNTGLAQLACQENWEGVLKNSGWFEDVSN